jgi:hypothetical protein
LFFLFVLFVFFVCFFVFLFLFFVCLFFFPDRVGYAIATRALLPTINEPHDHHNTRQCLHIAWLGHKFGEKMEENQRIRISDAEARGRESEARALLSSTGRARHAPALCERKQGTRRSPLFALFPKDHDRHS